MMRRRDIKRIIRAGVWAVAFVLAVVTFGCSVPAAGQDEETVELSNEEMYEVGKLSAIDMFMSQKTDNPNVLNRIVGAGFIVEKSGYVVTCSHVAGCPGMRTVGFHDTTSLDGELPFEIVGWNDGMDVAVVRIVSDGRTFTAAKLGKSRDAQVGDRVIIIGNPEARRHVVVNGKITSTAANWGYQWADAGTWHNDFLRCDAPAVEGFSGGPMINDRGEVIGMFSGNMGGGDTPASFAVPMHKILDGLPEVLNIEKLRGFVLGMSVAGMGDGTVTEVREDTPAAGAGVKKGDRVLSVNDQPVKVGFDFYYELRKSKPGDEVRLRLRRGRNDVPAVLRLDAPRLRPGIPAEELAAKLKRSLEPGLEYGYYGGAWNAVSDFLKAKPDKTGVANAIGIGLYAGQDNFGLVFSGYIRVEQAGTYTFFVGSDDGSQLYVDGELVVDNDGLHGPVAVGGNIGLEPGLHRLVVAYFERSGGEMLEVKYKGPGVGKQSLPASVLCH